METENDIRDFRQVIADLAKILPQIKEEADGAENDFGFIPHTIMVEICHVITSSYFSGQLTDADLKIIVEKMVSLSSKSEYLEGVVGVSFVETIAVHEDLYWKIDDWLPDHLKEQE